MFEESHSEIIEYFFRFMAHKHHITEFLGKLNFNNFRNSYSVNRLIEIFFIEKITDF